MRKKLVIIGANDFQNQVILKAKDKGFETHVFAWQCGDIGEKTADYFYPISIVEKEQILEKCKSIKPDGVVTIASDLASVTVNYVGEKLGLTVNGMESTFIATNKYAMRKTFERMGDPSPKYYRSDELTEEIMNQFTFPLIVKPVDRSGSRAVTKVWNAEDMMKAIKEAEYVSFEKHAMIEEFVEGKEYSVEYVSFQGEHTFLALTEKFTTGAPHFIETGHLQPAQVSNEILEKIKGVVSHALDSLKIKYGASHSEIKISEDGEIKIIEIGARMGGDCIGSDLVRLSTGYDFVDMVIDISCGMAPSFDKVSEPTTASIHFILTPDDLEELNRIKDERPNSVYRVSEIEPFDARIIKDSSTRYGYYIMRD